MASMRSGSPRHLVALLPSTNSSGETEREARRQPTTNPAVTKASVGMSQGLSALSGPVTTVRPVPPLTTDTYSSMSGSA